MRKSIRAVETSFRAPVGNSFLLSVLFIFCLLQVIVICGHGDKENALTVVESTQDESEDEGQIVNQDEEETASIVDEDVEEFQPTHEWQYVKEGQRIPPGLHVQMDFVTGEKQAKLMESDQKTDNLKIKRWDAGEHIGVINTEKPRYTREELKAALKDFKYQDVNADEEKHKTSVKENFRSYEELKKEMKNMQMAVKTEGEIVRELTTRLNQSEMDTDQLKTVLIDLEYYLHQIDNAQLFCDLGGMNSMLKLMNSSVEDIREFASFTLGAALQSNAKVQVAAMEAGVMGHLVRGLVTDPSRIVQKKILFALSTLLRQFPFAQQKFLEDGGLTALATLFEQADQKHIQIKIVTLLTDLLIERDLNSEDSSSADPVKAQRSQQYKNIKLREAMLSTGWCRLVPTLLQQHQEESAEHDSVEKVIHAMTALAEACTYQFLSARPVLQALVLRYSKLAAEETDDDFFSTIHTSLQSLVGQIYTREDL